LEVKDIVNTISKDDLLEEIGSQSCIDYFGSTLLNGLPIDDVLEHFSIEDIINHFGKESFKDYIREIFIDNVLKND